MRKPVTVAILAAIVLAALAVYLLTGRASGNGTAASYLTAPVTRADVEVTVMAEGTLKPANLVAVGAQVSGRITSLEVGLGDRVKAGDLIARIDSVTQSNALRKAEATLANIKAQQAEKRAVLALAEKTLSRQEALLKNSRTAQSDVDTATEEVAISRAQIEALDAQIAGAEVEIETARANLDYTRITAPSDGTVLALVNQAGQTVNAVQSSPTIVVLGQLDRMEVHASISEADIGKVEVGQQARFSLLGDSGSTFEGVLQDIAPAPRSIVNDSAINPESTSDSDSEAVYYTGIIPVDNTDGHLRSYMTAQVSILQGAARDVLTIPAMALGARDGQGGYAVRVLGNDGSIETRAVSVGLNDKVVVQVLDGLAEGEQVLTGEASAIPASSGSGGGAMLGPPPMGG